MQLCICHKEARFSTADLMSQVIIEWFSISVHVFLRSEKQQSCCCCSTACNASCTERAEVRGELLSGHQSAELANSTVLFAMIGRDVGSELPYVLSNIQSLSRLFKGAHVLLVENDSTDNTKEVFAAWAEKSKIQAELRSLPSGQGAKKLYSTLAKARNVYLQALFEDKYRHVDYLIALDTDMCYQWNVRRLERVLGALWSASSAWDVMYANGVQDDKFNSSAPHYYGHHPLEVKVSYNPIYYDLFALQDLEGRIYWNGVSCF
jgi:hypothetical protein